MHEMSLAARCIGIVTERAKEAGLTRVTRVTLQIGVMKAVVEELMQKAFTAVSRGTAAEGAEFCLVISPVVLRCTSCGEELVIDPDARTSRDYRCPHCGSMDFHIVGGNEFLVASLEGK